jgi:UDP-glucose 4-epimerase
MTVLDKLKNATVLVTGGCGYIGSHTVLALQSFGANPVVIDDLSNGDERLLAPGVPLIRGDCGDKALLAKTHAQHRFAAIVHFAGKIIVEESMSLPEEYYRVNTVAAHGLLGFAAKERVPIVFSSTAAVYGAPATEGLIQESATLNPISPYGRSKLATEWMIRDFHAAYGLPYAILRYFNVVGADPQGRAGQIGKQVTHLVKAASQAALGLRQLTVFGADYPTRDGTCERDYVHVADLADAHALAVGKLLEGEKALTLNCGYGRGFTVLEVISAFEDVMGRKLTYTVGPRRTADPPALVASNAAIVAALGWNPRFPNLRDAIKTALEWEKRLTNR